MANPVKGEVALVANGVRYLLVLDWNALCDLEQDFAGLTEGQVKVDMKKPTILRKMMWAALQAHHEGTTERQAGTIISGAGPDVAAAAIAKAFELGFPAAVEKDPPKPAGKTTPPAPAASAKAKRKPSTSKKR